MPELTQEEAEAQAEMFVNGFELLDKHLREKGDVVGAAMLKSIAQDLIGLLEYVIAVQD